jgi:hypothetical protein
MANFTIKFSLLLVGLIGLGLGLFYEIMGLAVIVKYEHLFFYTIPVFAFWNTIIVIGLILVCIGWIIKNIIHTEKTEQALVRAKV